MKTIGNFRFANHAADKPISVHTNGTFEYPEEVAARYTLSGLPLFSKHEDDRVKLALERVKREPPFRTGVLDIANTLTYTKEDIIYHIENQTEFGVNLVSAEMNYCDDLRVKLMKRSYPVIESAIQPVSYLRPEWHSLVPHEVLEAQRNTVLFCESTLDDSLKEGALYRINNVHNQFRERGFNVIALIDESDIRQIFATAARDKSLVYLSGLGHGDHITFTGYRTSPLLRQANYHADQVMGKIIYFLSCETAIKLGSDVVAHGAISYAGYIQKYFFYRIDDPVTAEQESPESFWKTGSSFDICMANGLSVREAHKVCINNFNAAIDQLPNTQQAVYHTWNRDAFISAVVNNAYGNPDVSIQPFKTP